MKLLLTCKDASRLLSERLDRALGLRERVQLRLHVGICDACSRLTRQFDVMRRAARRLAARKDG